MLWISLALGSAALLGVYEVARKSSVNDNAVLPVLFVANLGGLCALLLSLGGLLWAPETAASWSLTVDPLSTTEHLAILLKAVIVTTSWVCAYFAVKHLPISVAGPLRSLSPVITVLGALLLFQETPRPLQVAGMLVIFAGYVGFAWLGKAEGIILHADRWVGLLLIGTAVGATSGLYDKYLLQKAQLDPTTLQLWFTIDNVLLQGALTLGLWWNKRDTHAFHFRWAIPLVGVLLVLADQLYFRALANEDALVSVVALVRRTSVVVSFTLGGLLFREQLLRKKAVFLAVILAGLALLFV